ARGEVQPAEKSTCRTHAVCRFGLRSHSDGSPVSQRCRRAPLAGTAGTSAHRQGGGRIESGRRARTGSGQRRQRQREEWRCGSRPARRDHARGAARCRMDRIDLARDPRFAADRRSADGSEGLTVNWILHPFNSLHDLLLGFGNIGLVLWFVVCILCIAVPVIISVAMYVWWERKVLGWMHVRMGPNSVGPFGLAQTFADVFKLLLKEYLVPAKSSRMLFFLAPLISLTPALAAWAVIPFDAKLVLADVNAGLLYLLAMTSMGVYGIILAGWASNSKYAFLGAMRSA